MVRLGAAVLLALLLAGQGALASGGIECSSGDGEAKISVTIGSLPVLSVVRAEISVPGRRLATDGEGGDAIAVGQAFRDSGRIAVDLTDANVEAVVASLRLHEAMEGRMSAMAGILRVAGEGVWPVVCTGP